MRADDKGGGCAAELRDDDDVTSQVKPSTRRG
jgi:hypothetical protein